MRINRPLNWILWILLLSTRALALPLGAKEAFMANTGVGLAGSPGAVIYNPAGQAVLEHTRLSANTGFLYYSDSLEANTSSDVSLGGKSIYSTVQTVPGLLVTSFASGPWVLSFSLLVPMRSEVTIVGDQDVSQFVSNQQGTVTFSTTQHEESVNVGMTAARALSSQWLIGATEYIGRDLTWTQSSFFYNAPSNDQGFTRDLRQETVGYSLKAILGLMYRSHVYGDHALDLGMNIHLPNLYLSNQTSTSFTDTEFLSGTYSAPTSSRDDSGPDHPPWQFGLGFSTKLTPSLTILSDLNYVTETTDVTETNSGGFERTQKSSIANAGVGAVYTGFDKIELRAGYRYQQFLRPGLEDGLSRSFSYILSAGVHVVNPNFDTGIGLFFENDTADYSTPGISTPDPHRNQILSLAVLISGEYRL